MAAGFRTVIKRAPDYQKERGERQEARILAALADSPATSTKLAEDLCMGRCNVEIYMRRMRKKELVHISAHIKHHSGRPAPIWSIGKRDDAEYVPNRYPCPVQTVDERIQIARLLLRDGHTSRELAEKMNVSKGRAQKYVQMIRESAPAGKKVIYIAGWRHPGHRGDLAPIYRMGGRADKPKPKQTRADRYAAEKADPEKYEKLLQQSRTRHTLRRAKSKPQGIFAALGV